MKTYFAAWSIFCWTEHGLKVVPASFGSWATVCPSCPITRKGVGDTDAKYCLGCFSGAGTSLETCTIPKQGGHAFWLNVPHFKASQSLSSESSAMAAQPFPHINYLFLSTQKAAWTPVSHIWKHPMWSGGIKWMQCSRQRTKQEDDIKNAFIRTTPALKKWLQCSHVR